MSMQPAAIPLMEEPSAHTKVMNWKDRSVAGESQSESSEAVINRFFKAESVVSAKSARSNNRFFKAESVVSSKSMRYPAPAAQRSIAKGSKKGSNNSQDAISVARPFPTDVELQTELRCILNDQDLSKITRKSVRIDLERQFHCDLSSKKDFIKDQIAVILKRTPAS